MWPGDRTAQLCYEATIMAMSAQLILRLRVLSIAADLQTYAGGTGSTLSHPTPTFPWRLASVIVPAPARVHGLMGVRRSLYPSPPEAKEGNVPSMCGEGG